MNEIKNEQVKNTVGRPVGKKVNLEGIDNLWTSHSNKQLAEKYGTSIPNIWTHRKNAARRGVDSTYVKVKKADQAKVTLEEITNDFGA